MFETHIKTLSKNSKKLIKDGYFIEKVEDLNFLEELKDTFLRYQDLKWSIKVNDLSLLHNKLRAKNLNDIRYGFFKK